MAAYSDEQYKKLEPERTYMSLDKCCKKNAAFRGYNDSRKEIMYILWQF